MPTWKGCGITVGGASNIMKKSYWRALRAGFSIGIGLWGYLILLVGLTACQADPPPVNGSPTTQLDSFAATPEQPPLGVAAIFSWSISGQALVCQLDTDSDGQAEYTVQNCTSASRVAHTYPAMGNYPARLSVTGADGQTQQKSLAITVGAANRPPRILQFRLSRGSTAQNLRISWEVDDPDGQSTRCRIDTNSDGQWEADLPCNGGAQVSRQNLGAYSLELPLLPGQYNLTFEVSDAYSVTTRQQAVSFPPGEDWLVARFAAIPGPQQTAKVEVVLHDLSGSLRCELTVETLGRFSYPRCSSFGRILRFFSPGSYTLKLEVFDGSLLQSSQELALDLGNPLGFTLQLYPPNAAPIPVTTAGSIEFDDIIDVEDTGLEPIRPEKSSTQPEPQSTATERFIDQLELRYHLVYTSNTAPPPPVCLDLEWSAAWGRLTRSQLFTNPHYLFTVPLQFLQTSTGRWEAQGSLVYNRQNIELLRFENWYYARPAAGSPATVGGRGTLAGCTPAGTPNFLGSLQLRRFEVIGSEQQTYKIPLVQLSAGAQHTCALTAQGSKAYCWGNNSSGAAGLANPGNAPIPQRVQKNPNLPELGGGIAIHAGGMHSCGLPTSGAALCWGNNSSGQLGIGNYTPTSLPQLVLGNVNFASLDVGIEFSCGLTNTGLAYCWGSNTYGQLGLGNLNPQTSPQPLTGGPVFAQLALGSYHACGLDTGGLAYCWGQNGGGQLAVSSSIDVSIPEAVSGGLNFQRIVAGDGHTCAIATSSITYCWGTNAYGQAGSGNTYPVQTSPTPVVGGYTFGQLAAGTNFTCGLTPTGQAYCWGDNSEGQLGTGTVTDHYQPQAVATSLRFTSIAAGGHHACAVSTTGAAYCWGDNSSGQLGTSSPVNGYSNLPVPVALPLQTTAATGATSGE
jgi:alpha-tubulin suppressor-like RCC1 family protein